MNEKENIIFFLFLNNGQKGAPLIVFFGDLIANKAKNGNWKRKRVTTN